MKKALYALLLILAMFMTSSALAEEAPVLSLPSGFYDAPVTLTIAVPEGMQAVYTTDGSTPTAASTPVTGPIELGYLTDRHDPLSHITGIRLGDAFVPAEDFPSGHIIRTAIVLEDGAVGPVASATYFIGCKRDALYGELPVVMLAIDPDDLFGYERGIYVCGKVFDDWVATQPEDYPVWRGQGNYTQRGPEWERPITVTFLPADGSEGFTLEMGVRIKGSASRNSNQKSLRLIARSQYGEKRLEYQLFPGNAQGDGSPVTRYKSFTLRNGGNDNGFGTLRDPYLQRLAEGMRFETAATRPVICFINGEYWGLYTLTEEYTEQYFEYHYGLDDENVITVKCQAVEDGEPEDIELFRSAFDFIMNGDMADPDAYARACTLMDMASFADYAAYQFYILNLDGPFQNSNWQVWRVREPDDSHPYADGRWRWMVYDVDNTAGLYTDGASYDEDNISPVLRDNGEQWRHPARLLRSLMASPDFRREFIRALCEVRNLYFRPDRTAATLKEMAAEYRPALPDTFRRFGPEWALWDIHEYITTQTEYINDFFTGRYNAFLPIVQQALDLPEAVTVTIRGGAGQAVISGRTDMPLQGENVLSYFPGCTLTVEALPPEGKTFLRWEADGATLEDSASPIITFTVTGPVTLNAIYE